MLQDSGIRQAQFQEQRDVAVRSAELLVQRVAVDHVQRLRDGRIEGALRGVADATRRAPEDVRNCDFTCVSGNCRARVPAG